MQLIMAELCDRAKPVCSCPGSERKKKRTKSHTCLGRDTPKDIKIVTIINR
jgi:hypothetical protein